MRIRSRNSLNPIYSKGPYEIIFGNNDIIFIDNVRRPSDVYIFASRHKSESEIPCLTVHPTGNFSNDTSHGGRAKELSPTHSFLMKKALLLLKEIAEKEKVEFFSPLNEPNLMFTSQELVDQWINKSQELRSVFSGDLVLKFADTGPQNIENIESYDYLAFDIMWSDPTYQELKDYLETAVEKGSDLKKQYNLKGFFFGELGAERSMVNKSVQTQIFEIFLNETWGNVDGYCFLGWSDLEFKFRDNDNAKEIIREWFSKMD